MSRVITRRTVWALLGSRLEGSDAMRELVVMESEDGWVGCTSLMLRGVTNEALDLIPALWADWIERVLENASGECPDCVPKDARRARDGKTYVKIGEGWFAVAPLAYAQPDRTVVMENILPTTRGNILVGYRAGEPVIILADAGLGDPYV